MRRVLVVLAIVGLVGCGVDPNAGVRFRAERDLYRTSRALQDASLRPNLTGDDQRRSLAESFEAIADRHTVQADPANLTDVQKEIQILGARSLFAAAQVYGSLGDSTKVLELFSRIEREFAHLPDVAGEVALAQGGVAEGRGDVDSAVRYYRLVVDGLEPDPRSTGAAGVVLDLPLRIARLMRVKSVGVDSTGFAEAREYYETKAESVSDALVRLDARTRLAETVAEIGDWSESTRILRGVEKDLLGFEEPPRDPAMIRYYIAASLFRGGAPRDSIERAMQSVLSDYPRTAAALESRRSLSDIALSEDRVEDAIVQLDRIREEFAGNDEICAQALLRKANILEIDDSRWGEALEAYRAVAADYPITEAALQSPLAIARHYWRVGDESATKTALEQAHREYQDFVRRYPPGRQSFMARERLVDTLILQEDFEGAIKEMLALGENLSQSPRGSQLFLAAAQVAFTELADTARAATILERAGDLYAGADVGKWASGEAARLRELVAP